MRLCINFVGFMNVHKLLPALWRVVAILMTSVVSNYTGRDLSTAATADKTGAQAHYFSARNFLLVLLFVVEHQPPILQPLYSWRQ